MARYLVYVYKDTDYQECLDRQLEVEANSRQEANELIKASLGRNEWVPEFETVRLQDAEVGD